ncbi:hypothetical protein BKA93DRAFT_831255 [Sparassis latifolia]
MSANLLEDLTCQAVHLTAIVTTALAEGTLGYLDWEGRFYQEMDAFQGKVKGSVCTLPMPAIVLSAIVEFTHSAMPNDKVQLFKIRKNDLRIFVRYPNTMKDPEPCADISMQWWTQAPYHLPGGNVSGSRLVAGGQILEGGEVQDEDSMGMEEKVKDRRSVGHMPTSLIQVQAKEHKVDQEPSTCKASTDRASSEDTAPQPPLSALAEL